MSAVTSAFPPVFDETTPARGTKPRAMTGCECAGVSFEEIARQIQADGVSLEEAARRTGCGGTCTACVADLRRFLERY